MLKSYKINYFQMASVFPLSCLLLISNVLLPANKSIIGKGLLRRELVRILLRLLQSLSLNKGIIKAIATGVYGWGTNSMFGACNLKGQALRLQLQLSPGLLVEVYGGECTATSKCKLYTFAPN